MYKKIKLTCNWLVHVLIIAMVTRTPDPLFLPFPSSLLSSNSSSSLATYAKGSLISIKCSCFIYQPVSAQQKKVCYLCIAAAIYNQHFDMLIGTCTSLTLACNRQLKFTLEKSVCMCACMRANTYMAFSSCGFDNRQLTKVNECCKIVLNKA